MPKRIQLSRKRDWRLPPRTVKVDRTTRFGNPYRINEHVDLKQAKRWGWNISPQDRKCVCLSSAEAVARFRHALLLDAAIHDFVRKELGGRDLACWCAADQPCHADVLIEIANSDPSDINAIHEEADRKIKAFDRQHGAYLVLPWPSDLPQPTDALDVDEEPNACEQDEGA